MDSIHERASSRLTSVQYYIFTKNPLPMDIEFLVHDIYTGTRPQWKLASNLEEASKAFQLVLAQDRKAAGLDEPEHQDHDDDASGSSTEDDMADVDDDDDAEVDEDEVAASEDEDEDEDDDVRLTSPPPPDYTRYPLTSTPNRTRTVGRLLRNPSMRLSS
jgi:regulator of nonsense transcripts 2